MPTDKTSRTFHYSLTFICAAALIGCFLTNIITGNDPLLTLDSFGGSLLIGLVLFGYAVWFVFDQSAAEKRPFRETARRLMVSSTAILCIYAFWFVFVIVPFLFRNFFKI